MFYLHNDLPDCMFSLEIIEDLIWERFKQYTSANLQHDTEELYTCDIVSHLFMAIIAVDYPLFKSIFIRGELKIFNNRLMQIKCKERLKTQLPTVLQYLEGVKNKKFKRSDKLQLVLNIIQTVMSKSSHVFDKDHSKKCRKLKLILPFTFLLRLVAKREVEVKDGKVCLSCGQWDEVLVCVAHFLLQVELKMIENDENLRKNIYYGEDDRMRQIIKRFINFLNGNLGEVNENLKAEDVDKKSAYFPPCMANLHQILRQSHRLSYNSRYQYTLFLKDIGLSVDENIEFWESEYSKPHSGSSCTHEWEEKHKRYKYQIQHLYGMIGTHGLKTSHGCGKFIEKLETKMDGGCPFQHFTREELEKALPRNLLPLPDIEDIFKFKDEGMVQKACGVYLKCQQKIATGKREFLNNFYILSPLQYYTIAKAL